MTAVESYRQPMVAANLVRMRDARRQRRGPKPVKVEAAIRKEH